jgi:branched-chain amino acid transport system ATP-binding protein
LTAFYGDFQALYGIDLHVDEGETIAIVGANGAGKSTLMSAHHRPARHAPREMIEFDGKPIGGMKPAEIMARGIALVPEGRRLFPSLTVEENLLVGNYGRKVRGAVVARRDLPPLPGPEGTAQPGLDLAVGRAAADGGAGPRAYVEPAPAPVRRDQPRPRARRSSRTSTPPSMTSAPKAPASSWWNRTSVRRWRWPTASIACSKGRVTLTGRPGDLSRDQISAAYFGGGA